MRERCWLIGLFCFTLAIRLLAIDQPIVENYVGRQIPSAMVARNLERGSGFLFPQLDTAPFPSLFLVEPPIYQEAVVLLARWLPISLEAAGRAVSGLAIGLGGVSLYLLVRHQAGAWQASTATLIFAAMPVTVRYGRAFQPDALALGLVLTGTMLWDRWRVKGGAVRADLAWLTLATGLAVKVLWIFALLPAGWLIWQRLQTVPQLDVRRRIVALVLILGSLLIPACFWYVHAARCMSVGATASTVNASVWLSVLEPRSWFSMETAHWIFRFGVVRAFSTLGVVLAAWGLWKGQGVKLWRLWALGASGILVLVAGKLHHEYYWLLLAPAVAAAAVEGLACVRRLRPGYGGGLISGFLMLTLLGTSIYHARTTWTTPPEWVQFQERGLKLGQAIPGDALMIGREAVIYAANRRGMRMEWNPAAVKRALGEWGVEMKQEKATPAKLISWYHLRGARYFAEMADPRGPTPEFPGDPSSVDRVIFQEPGLLLLKLTEPDHADNEG